MGMMKKGLFVFVLFCCFSSCGNKAADFNDSLVKIQKSVLDDVKSFSEKVQNIGADSLPHSNVKLESDKLLGVINAKIEEAESLSAPGGAKEFQLAILKQLQFEKNIVSKIGKLADNNTPQVEKQGIEMEFLNSQDSAMSIEQEIHNAQEAFAKEHKFKLEKK
jgi:hypothetical protein